MTHIIRIADDYSRSPGGRYTTDGPFSGERFRNEILVPALKSHLKVEVDLSGVMGFGSSFLEEAFGGIVREKLCSKDEMKKKLHIKSRLKTYESRIWKYVDEARPGAPRPYSEPVGQHLLRHAN